LVITVEWQKITTLKSFITLANGGKLKYQPNLPWNFTLENIGTAVNYHGMFITLALG
jgi:hypothetical protein